MARLALIHDPLFAQHDPGPGHPESAGRMRAVLERLETAGLLAQLPRLEPRPATTQQLLRVHTQGHIDHVLEYRGRGPAVLDLGDTVISADSVDAALLAAGAGVAAVEAVAAGECDRVFCAVRPPGHHARPDSAMGFCLFNNIAVCAAHALASGFERVLIVDWDVHHGNGTQEMFYDSDRVCFLSLHRAAFFPGTGHAHETGSGPGAGLTVNRPLRAGAGDEVFAGVMQEALQEIESRFVPDLVLISAGFDAHAADPVGGMKLSEAGFREMTDEVVRFARRHAEGRVISFLEGGYDHAALAGSVEAHLLGLLES